MDGNFHGTGVNPPFISQWQTRLTWPEPKEEAGQGVSVQKERISKSKEMELSFRSVCLAAFQSPLVSAEAYSPIELSMMDMCSVCTVQVVDTSHM